MRVFRTVLASSCLFLFSNLLQASAFETGGDCDCNVFAANLPGVTLIHSSGWGKSGLATFILPSDFNDGDIEKSVQVCEDLRKKLQRMRVCKLKEIPKAEKT